MSLDGFATAHLAKARLALQAHPLMSQVLSPKQVYSVIDFGKTLLPHVEALMKWGQDNYEQIIIKKNSHSAIAQNIITIQSLL